MVNTGTNDTGVLQAVAESEITSILCAYCMHVDYIDFTWTLIDGCSVLGISCNCMVVICFGTGTGNITSLGKFWV